jgi:hypothetical protein
MAGTAQVSVLHEGYAREEDGADRVGSTVTLIVDGGRVIVVDPGLVSGRDTLLAALAAQGPDPAGVTDVVFSHHHPDHTVNAALFPRAVIHDHWASYDRDRWISREPGDFALSASVRLIATPGHARGHHHARRHAGRRVRVHARLVGPGRPGRRPARRGPGRAAPEPGPHPRGGHRDHPWARPRLPPRPAHPEVGPLARPRVKWPARPVAW